MCCFSRPVISVSATNIFARPTGDGRQVLVYSMSLHAREPLAMILPIPVAVGAGEKALQFVNLEGYPDFFAYLRRGFPEPLPAAGDSLGVTRGAPSVPKPLAVEKVGSFVASFVPKIADFSRLDARFRLDDGVWQKLGQYADYGFAVFQLQSGRARIHPMAFLFPTAQPGTIFFPTVHIHDGKVHPRAEFDHALYCQVAKGGLHSVTRWEESVQPVGRYVDVKHAQNLVVGERHLYRRLMHGTLANEDVVLRAA